MGGGTLWRFVTLSDGEEIRERRELLDRHATIAQASTVLPLLLIITFRMFMITAKAINLRGQSQSIKRGDLLKLQPADRSERNTSWRDRRRRRIISTSEIILREVRKLGWWASEPVFSYANPAWGSKGDWILASTWTAWLIFLCVRQTGDDYLHLTKRFGIVAASQLPIQLLLAWKSAAWNPIAYITRLSHEQLNRYHRMLARIIYALVVSHVLLYFYFFIGAGVLMKRLKDVDVLVGIAGSMTLDLVMFTSASRYRRWNYRGFILIHVVGSMLLLPILYFHVVHIRRFMLQSVFVYAVGQILRTLNCREMQSSVGFISGTNLLKIEVSPEVLNTERELLKWTPGQHIYLSIKNETSATAAVTTKLFKNPFTIASFPNKGSDIAVIARTLKGSTAKLASMLQNAEMHDGEVTSSASTRAPLTSEVSLAIEGPYGSAATILENMASSSSILLVAGGIGATFAIPLYLKVLLSKQPSMRLRLIWAVRHLDETLWVPSILDDSNVADISRDNASIDLYVTQNANLDGDENFDRVNSNTFGERKENERHRKTINQQPEAIHKAKNHIQCYAAIHHSRPLLDEIIDDTFTNCDERGGVSVLVCGPQSMIQAVKKKTGSWVRGGREVYYHAEEFNS